MKYYSNRVIETLAVDFHEVKMGWIFFKVTVGNQVFESRFSEVLDPILDFKHWLEAIAIGVQQVSFSYDPEGVDIKFDFERITWEWDEFSVTEFYASKKRPPLIKATISRKQLVYAFYHGFLEFLNSDKFDLEVWLYATLKDNPVEKIINFRSKIIENYLDIDIRLL